MGTQTATQTKSTATPVVTAAPAVLLQRTCDCGKHTLGGEECDDCKKKKLSLHRRAMNSFSPRFAPAIVHDVLRSPGQPLDGGTRAFMESRFHRDLGQVRLHTDVMAGDSAKSVDALAYTVGRHIAFGHGQYQENSASSQRLLQHELVHTIQQSHVSDGHIRASEGKLEVGDPNHSFEREASAYEGAAEPTHDAISSGEKMSLRREPAKESSAEAGTAKDAPGAYDSCAHPEVIEKARSQASTNVQNAIDLLKDNNIQQAAPLLEAHFHLDVTQPDSNDTILLIRSQFGRMKAALDSGIRIFCRSAPSAGLGSPRPTMPVDQGCAADVAHSTSCAAGNETATVILCETSILELGSPLVKTIIHEFAHVACNGNPAIQSGGPAGGEIYYDGDRLPGAEKNVLNQGDSYAWFAMKAPTAAPVPAPAGQPAAGKSGSSRLPWLAVLGAGVALGIAGIWAHGLLLGAALGVGIGIAGLAGAFESKPAPTSIKVVENHQVPLDEAAVQRGWRSGFGGVAEIEVSNGDTNYDGSEIKEHFVAGHCENANRSGQGGTGGSTFTVGRAVSNNDLGMDISFPAKRNTFYDQHLFGAKTNVLPPGKNDEFSVCVQQYTFDGAVIENKNFLRRYDIHRSTIAGQDVAMFALSTSEETAGANPAATPAATPNPTPPEAQPAPSANPAATGSQS